MKKGEKYLIEIADVTQVADDQGDFFPVARIKGFSSLMFDQKGLDKLTQIAVKEEKSLSEKLNCKFVVVSTENNVGLSVGKIYEVKDGKFIDDKNDKYPLMSKYLTSFSDLEKYLGGMHANVEYYSYDPIKILRIVE